MVGPVAVALTVIVLVPPDLVTVVTLAMVEVMVPVQRETVVDVRRGSWGIARTVAAKARGR